MVLTKQNKNNAFNHLTDKEVIARILTKGDKELFNVLYDRYSSVVYYKCYAFAKNQADAKDLTHDVLIKVFLNLSKFKGTSKFSLWVNTITYNHCVDYFKKKKKLEKSVFSEAELEKVEDDISGIEEKELKEIQLSQLETLLNEMNIDDKMLLLMYYKDDLSIKQIKAILKIGESAVKMRLQRARKRLAKAFKNLKNNEEDVYGRAI